MHSQPANSTPHKPTNLTTDRPGQWDKFTVHRSDKTNNAKKSNQFNQVKKNAWQWLKQGIGHGVAIAALAMLPVSVVRAEPLQVKGIELSSTSGELQITLTTNPNPNPNDPNALAQIITINRGNSWIAEINNASLNLAEGESFHRTNPAPGITSITIIPLDHNTVQAIVTGKSAAIKGTVKRNSANQIVLSLSQVGIPASVPAPVNLSSNPPGPDSDRSTPTQLPQAPTATTVNPATPRSVTNPFAVPAPDSATDPAVNNQPITPPTSPPPEPQIIEQAPVREIIIPNPAIENSSALDSINDYLTLPETDLSEGRSLPAPTSPKAAAPPVGDIAVTTINISPNVVDLDLDERVPALVLRDAPVREVLSVLANTAGLNTVFVEGDDPNQSTINTTISMEIRNETVESVFNYVLQVARLQANRIGNTVLIGRNLPATARGLIVRTLRLNQLKASVPETEITTTVTTASSTTSGGGNVVTTGENTTSTQVDTNSRVSRDTSVSQKLPIKGAKEILEDLGANNGGLNPRDPQNVARQRLGEDEPDQLLSNLEAIADNRTNTITLVGTPNLVGIAIDYLRQLDVRRRQAAINVKIIEVSLDRNENIGASFSFGVNDSFFSMNQGDLRANFGEINPSRIPPADANPGSLFSPDIIQSPIDRDGVDGITRPFQFPRNFLLNLQARIQTNDARVLTDPTLIVQEGSSSQVNLTSQVFAGFRQITEPAPGNEIRTVSETRPPIDVGVILNIHVDHIDDHGYVTLSVSPEVSSPGERITDPSQNDLLIQQLVNRRRLETGNVRLKNGQTLILAGIIEESERTITSKTPLLGDIPLLGALFRRTTDQRDRNEVIVLVTPNVIE
jgi:type IV pilus assembly protein PilQ